MAVVATAMGVALAIRGFQGADTTPGSPAPTGHVPTSTDPDFWNSDRMRRASPAPMPTVPR